MFVPYTCLFCIAIAAATAAVTQSDRKVLIDAAIQEASAISSPTHNAGGAAHNVSTTDNPKGLLSTTFKRASPEALKQGKARILLEEMVYRAERKLLEDERQSMEDGDAETKAEVLAKELFHKPGSLLTNEEIAKMFRESGCEDTVEQPRKCPTEAMNRQHNIDGTCNNLQHPLFGAATTPFRRLIPPQYEDGVCQLRGTIQSQETGLFVGPFSPPNPSARLVSLNIIRDRPEAVENNFSHLIMQWGQFLDHDLSLASEFEIECKDCFVDGICVPIQVPSDDPSFGTAGSGKVCHPFTRSVPVCDSSTPTTLSPREQLNEVTSFIDGSQIYGFSSRILQAVRDPLRTSKLKTGPNLPGIKPSLPIDDVGVVSCPKDRHCFLAGDIRVNEHTALIVMHTIWMREHNRIAEKLSRINPFWSTSMIFNVTKQIVTAEIQRITFKEYLPAVMGKDVFDSLIKSYTAGGGYNPQINPSVPNAFASAAFRFVHSQIRPFFDRLDENYNPLNIGPLSLLQAFFNISQYEQSGGTDPLLRGMLSTPPLQVDEFLNKVLTTHFLQTHSFDGLDLASLNIQRGRDHGIPPHVTWQRWAQRECNISSDFENQLTFIRLLQTYGSLETVDLWVGGLAEERLQGSLLGATFACIFAKTFGPIRHGDRFYYENEEPEAALFTAEQRAAIENASISRVICDNSDNIQEIQAKGFYSNETRVPCSSLPSVDLMAWKVACNVQIQVNPQSTPISFLSYSTLRYSGKAIKYEVSLSAGETNVCVGIQCPTAYNPTLIFIFPHPPSNAAETRTCSQQPNTLLPPNLARRDDAYCATVGKSYVMRSRSGLFRNQESCEASINIALNYTCTSTCQIKIQVNPQDTSTVFVSLFRDSEGIIMSYQQTLAAGETKLCLRITCPTPTENSTVFVRPNLPPETDDRMCAVELNPGSPLPENEATGASVYFTDALSMSHLTPRDGVFKSLGSCSASSNIALQYTCTNSQAALQKEEWLLQELEMALFNQEKTNTVTNGEVLPIDDPHIPDYVREYLENEPPTSEAEGRGGTSHENMDAFLAYYMYTEGEGEDETPMYRVETPTKDEMRNEVNTDDSQLLADLQDALGELQ